MRRPDVDDLQGTEVATIPCERAATGVRQPSRHDRGGLDVDEQQVLLESLGACDHVALVVDHEGVAVEDELVLAADGVAQCNERSGVARAGAEHLLPFAVAQQMERRGRDVDDQLRAGEREVGGGRSRLPHVLAHGDADQRFAVLEEIEPVSRREVAELVEDTVVRQEALLHECLHLAGSAHRGSVVEVSFEVRRADDGDDAARGSRDLLERALGRTHEARAEQQVLGRITRDSELGKEHEVGARGSRVVEPLEDQRAVPGEVTDDRVDLCECKPHGCVHCALRNRCGVPLVDSSSCVRGLQLSV